MATRKSNGEGSLYYSNSLERWVIQYVEPGTKTKKKIVQKKNEPEKEFKKRYFSLINSINEREYNFASKITLEDIIDEQIEAAYKAHAIKPTSYLRMKATFNRIKELSISNVPIQSLTVKQINNSLLHITHYADSVIVKVCGMLSSAYDYAVINNIVNSNPFKINGAVIRPKSEKPTKKIEAFTVEEQKLFLKQLKISKDKYSLALYIAIYTGMRAGEILALDKQDIKLEDRKIKVNNTITRDRNDKPILGDTTKTYSSVREVPIIKSLYNILKKENLRNNGLLFHDNNKIVNPSTLNAHFKKICKDAGIQVVINTNKTTKDRKGNKIKVNLKTSSANVHMLRHTFATRCIEAGMSAVALSKILGHKDIKTTLNTYTSVFDKYQKSELEKVEDYLNKL